MTKDKALQIIKFVRGLIHDQADCSATAEGWENEVCEHLDAAADCIEFPVKVTHGGSK